MSLLFWHVSAHIICNRAAPLESGSKHLQFTVKTMLSSRMITGRLCLIGKTRGYGFCGSVRAISTSGSTSPLSLQPLDVQTVQSGELGSSNFSIFFTETADGRTISPWHDISLFSDVKDGGKVAYFNFINEIPRYTKPKMEIATTAKLNPIVQDTKKGKLREYHGPLYWNYGCLPQTWEDPNVPNPEVNNYMGDNDPLDVVEIGSKTLDMGAVFPVKPLGILSMIDGGELDWKLIAICAEDPMADKLNGIDDVELHCPGTISGIREWFRWYKTPDGKDVNTFGHNEVALDSEFAVEVINETHSSWKNLFEGVNEPNKLWLK